MSLGVRVCQILKKVLEEENIPMPDCISISMDGNNCILFNGEKF